MGRTSAARAVRTPMPLTVVKVRKKSRSVSALKPINFGALLAAAAAREGVTQTELARRLDVTQHRVSEIYRSESITEALLRRCVRALRLRLDVKIVKGRAA